MVAGVAPVGKHSLLINGDGHLIPDSSVRWAVFKDIFDVIVFEMLDVEPFFSKNLVQQLWWKETER